MSRFLIVLLIFAALPLSAFAQTRPRKPVAAPVAQPDQQTGVTDAWEQQPPASYVIEKNDTFNFRFYPIGLVIGWFAADLDIKVSPNWTVGPSATYWKWKQDRGNGFTSDFEVKSFRLGARANWFMNGTYTDGLYLAPSLDYYNVRVSTTDSSGPVEGKVNYFGVTGLVGYGWFWNSFNMMAGIGGTIGVGNSNVEVRSTSNGTRNDVSSSRTGGLALEYSLGFTF